MTEELLEGFYMGAAACLFALALWCAFSTVEKVGQTFGLLSEQIGQTRVLQEKNIE